MIVKRNSAEFKQIKEMLDDLESSAERRKLVHLYSMQHGEPVPIKTNSADAKVVYDLSYGSVMDYLRDRGKKLFRDEETGRYYFAGNSKSEIHEFPFELKGKLLKEIKAVLKKA